MTKHMATIRQFEDLKIWKLARQLAKDVYAMTCKAAFSKDFGLRDQIQRAAVSIGSNIAEGFERDSNSELAKFLSYAKGSAGEVRSQLYTALDLGYISETEANSMRENLIAESRMISRFQSSEVIAKPRR